MIKSKFTTILIFTGLIFVMSCGSSTRRKLLKPEEHYEKAKSYFDSGKYLKALDELTIIIYQFSGSSVIDDAQYYLAECHFNMKEYILAADEYERLVRNYPESEWADDSLYKIGLSYYKLSPKYSLDQAYTQKAIKAYQEFLDEFPDSEIRSDAEEHLRQARNKLARKTFESGNIYRKMAYYHSAIVYFDLVLKDYYDTEYVDDSEFWKAYCKLKSKNFEEAAQEFEDYLQKYPESKLKDKAGEYMLEARSKLSTDTEGNPVTNQNEL